MILEIVMDHFFKDSEILVTPHFFCKYLRLFLTITHGIHRSHYDKTPYNNLFERELREIKHRDDWCNFILMDYRYQSHLNLLSQWTLMNGVHTL
jgi:hypothetical protein